MSATRTLSRAKPIFELNVRFLVDLVSFVRKLDGHGRPRSLVRPESEPLSRLNSMSLGHLFLAHRPDCCKDDPMVGTLVRLAFRLALLTAPAVAVAVASSRHAKRRKHAFRR